MLLRKSLPEQIQQSTSLLFKKKNDNIQLASSAELTQKSIDFLDTQLSPNQFVIEKAITASRLSNNQGYMAVIDSFSSAGNGYCPSVHRLSDANNEHIQPFCITDYSLYPTTPAMASLDNHGIAILAWLHWEKDAQGYDVGNICVGKFDQDGLPPLSIPFDSSIGSQCDITKAHHVYNQPNSLAVTTFADGSFLLAWTQVCYYFDQTPPNAFGNLVLFDANNAVIWSGLYFSSTVTEKSPGIKSTPPTNGIADYGITTNSMLAINDSYFTIAYYSSEATSARSLVCFKPRAGVPGIACSDIFNAPANGNRFNIKMALHNTMLVSAWESQDVYGRQQIEMNACTLIFSGLDLTGFAWNMPTQPISYDDSLGPYQNINHDMAISDANNVLFTWNRYSAATGVSANVIVRQIDIAHPESIHAVPNFITTSGNFNNQGYTLNKVTYLKNGLFAINSIDSNGQFIARNFSEMNSPLLKDSSPSEDHHSFSVQLILLNAFIGICMFSIMAKIIHAAYGQKFPHFFSYKKLSTETENTVDDIEMHQVNTETSEARPINKSNDSIINRYATYQSLSEQSAARKNNFNPELDQNIESKTCVRR